MLLRIRNPFQLFRSGESTLRNPTDWLTEAFGAFKSKAGVAVNEQTSLRLTSVHACVRIISENLSRLPVSILKVEADGDKIPQRKHPVYKLLSVAPNEYHNPYNFDRLMYTYRLLYGNAYAYIKRDPSSFQPIELIPLYPWCVTPYLIDGVLKYFNGDVRFKEIPRWLKPYDVFHLRAISLDGFEGKSPIKLHAESLGINIASEGYGASWFGNSAIPAGFIKTPGSLKPDQATLIEDQWKQANGGKNRNRVAVLTNGSEFIKMSVPPEEAQFLETRKYGNLDVARIYGVPPHMLAELDRATFSNIEEQSIEFVRQTLQPYAEEYEQETKSKLLTTEEALYTEVEHDFSELLRSNAAAFADYISKLTSFGLLSINEGRHMLNMNSVEGGDQRFINAALMPIDIIGDYYTAQVNAKQPSQQRIIGFDKKEFKEFFLNELQNG